MGVTKGELCAELGLPEQVTVSTPALVWQKRDAVNSRVLLFMRAEKQSRPACSTERSRVRARDRDPRVPWSPLLSGPWLFMIGLLYEILWCPYKTFSFLLTLVQVISISWTWKSPHLRERPQVLLSPPGTGQAVSCHCSQKQSIKLVIGNIAGMTLRCSCITQTCKQRMQWSEISKLQRRLGTWVKLRSAVRTKANEKCVLHLLITHASPHTQSFSFHQEFQITCFVPGTKESET